MSRIKGEFLKLSALRQKSMLRILKLALGIGQVLRFASDCSAEYIGRRTLEILVLA